MQVGYVEETNAGNAIAALKERLAPECSVCRNGEYVLVPVERLTRLRALPNPPATPSDVELAARVLAAIACAFHAHELGWIGAASSAARGMGLGLC